MNLMAGDALFVDTNILLTATVRDRPLHRHAQDIFSVAPAKGVALALSGQVLREYLVVATRPLDANGLALSPSEAAANVEEFQRRARLLEENEFVARKLRDLVLAASMTGRRIHDGNVAATLLHHGLTLLLTENGSDYRDVPGVITVALKDTLEALHRL